MFCRKASYRPELVWTCFWSVTEMETEGLFDESLAISSELGMRPLMERVLSRREILGA